MLSSTVGQYQRTKCSTVGSLSAIAASKINNTLTRGREGAGLGFVNHQSTSADVGRKVRFTTLQHFYPNVLQEYRVVAAYHPQIPVNCEISMLFDYEEPGH